MTNPLGNALELIHGEHRVVVNEVGASLQHYEIAGVPLVSGPTLPPGTVDLHKGSRGAVLMPWPNRVQDGKYSVNGDSLQLPITEAARGHATHGFVRTARWTVDQHDDTTLALTTRIFAQPGWPFVFDANITYRLDSEGLSVTMGATNVGVSAFPFVMGIHPYFTVGDRVDDWSLTVPAASRLVLDDKLIPTGIEPVKGTPLAFDGQAVGDLELDVTYTDLASPGRNAVRLQGPDRGLEVWMDETFGYVQVFSGDTLSVKSDRRKTLAIEPMTGAPNAFNSGDGLIRLEPGASVSGTWGVRPL